jgi:dimethylhistidine N-methyltransferase
MLVFAASKINPVPFQERTFQPIGDPISLAAFAQDVRNGLTKNGQKELYSKYLYDSLGSALFEAITVLPEYGLTRADSRLLRRHARDLAGRLGRPCLVVELGSGSGTKTRWILSELASKEPITYCPIDISESALHQCWRDLSQIDSVEVVPFAQSYLDGLREANRLRKPGTSMLVLFLGSTIGNFEPQKAVEFVYEVRKYLVPGDVFYLSTDLEKETNRMIAAYDDPTGVTSAFNLNLLARINRELGANFLLSQFRHEARYDEQEHRIEMHLRSTREQTVRLADSFLTNFKQDETIWTESSYKFRLQDIVALAQITGFNCETQWVDDEWPFAQNLFRAA